VALTQKTSSGHAGWKETRTAGLHISEAVINYLFLDDGQLEQDQNREMLDVLSNFEYACAAVAKQGTIASDLGKSGPRRTKADVDSAMLPASTKNANTPPNSRESRRRET
jgi:hypothetical protein